MIHPKKFCEACLGFELEKSKQKNLPYICITLCNGFPKDEGDFAKYPAQNKSEALIITEKNICNHINQKMTWHIEPYWDGNNIRCRVFV